MYKFIKTKEENNMKWTKAEAGFYRAVGNKYIYALNGNNLIIRPLTTYCVSCVLDVKDLKAAKIIAEALER